MSTILTNEFAQFAKEKLRPAVDKVQSCRRSGLRYALLAAGGVFAIFALLVYISLAPFREMLDNHQITYWPLLFLGPLAFAMVGFSLVYIFLLRNAVKVFRFDLIERLAEFIHPGLVHEQDNPISVEDMERSLLFRQLARPKSGTDRFRARVGDANVELSDLRVCPDTDKSAPCLSGVFFSARFTRRFAMPIVSLPTSVEVSRSDMESELRRQGYDLKEGLVRFEDPADGRQVLLPSGQERNVSRFLPSRVVDALDRLRQQHGVEVLLSAFGNRLYIAMLSAVDRTDLPGVFEGFDFSNCRLFCGNARLAMEIARDMGKHADLFE